MECGVGGLETCFIVVFFRYRRAFYGSAGDVIVEIANPVVRHPQFQVLVILFGNCRSRPGRARAVVYDLESAGQIHEVL